MDSCHGPSDAVASAPVGGGYAEITVDTLHGGVYTRRYDSFTLLIRSGDKYFLISTPTDKQTAWKPADDAVFIIPDDNDVRIQLTRVRTMPRRSSRRRRGSSASLLE